MVEFEALRAQYRPAAVRVLFIGESAPDPGGAKPRFFYLPALSQHDNLFRGLMLALYGCTAEDLGQSKLPWLGRFRRDGYWLIDVAERPINRLSDSLRRKELRRQAPLALRRISDAKPSVGVIICHSKVFDELRIPLARGGVRVLHDTAIPFPLGNCRQEFAARVRDALGLPGA